MVCHNFSLQIRDLASPFYRLSSPLKGICFEGDGGVSRRVTSPESLCELEVEVSLKCVDFLDPCISEVVPSGVLLNDMLRRVCVVWRGR